MSHGQTRGVADGTPSHRHQRARRGVPIAYGPIVMVVASSPLGRGEGGYREKTRTKTSWLGSGPDTHAPRYSPGLGVATRWCE